MVYQIILDNYIKTSTYILYLFEQKFKACMIVGRAAAVECGSVKRHQLDWRFICGMWCVSFDIYCT